MSRLLTWWILASWCCAPQWAAAQPYPNKPLRLIVPWTIGSGTDLMSRVFAHKLGETLGQQVFRKIRSPWRNWSHKANAL